MLPRKRASVGPRGNCRRAGVRIGGRGAEAVGRTTGQGREADAGGVMDWLRPGWSAGMVTAIVPVQAGPLLDHRKEAGQSLHKEEAREKRPSRSPTDGRRGSSLPWTSRQPVPFISAMWSWPSGSRDGAGLQNSHSYRYPESGPGAGVLVGFRETGFAADCGVHLEAILFQDSVVFGFWCLQAVCDGSSGI